MFPLSNATAALKRNGIKFLQDPASRLNQRISLISNGWLLRIAETGVSSRPVGRSRHYDVAGSTAPAQLVRTYTTRNGKY